MQKNPDQNVDSIFIQPKSRKLIIQFNEVAGLKHHLSLSPPLVPVAIII